MKPFLSLTLLFVCGFTLSVAVQGDTSSEWCSPGFISFFLDGSPNYVPKIIRYQLLDQLQNACLRDDISEIKRLYNQIHYLLGRFSSPSPDAQDDTSRIRQIIFSGKLPVSYPRGVFLGGGTASGKSSISQSLEEMVYGSNYVLIDPDAIMFELTGYPDAVAVDRCAASKFHQQASSLADLFFNESIAGSYNFIIDGTMKTASTSLNRIEQATSAGTEVFLVGVTAPIATCAVRAASRAAYSGRWVPLSIIVSSHVGFSSSWTQYVDNVNHSRIYLFGSDPETYPIIEAGKVLSQQAYHSFLLKAKETLTKVRNSIDDDTREAYALLACQCDPSNLDPDFVCPNSTTSRSTTTTTTTTTTSTNGCQDTGITTHQQGPDWSYNYAIYYPLSGKGTCAQSQCITLVNLSQNTPASWGGRTILFVPGSYYKVYQAGPVTQMSITDMQGNFGNYVSQVNQPAKIFLC